jgi:hypothetical protein
MSEPTQFHRLFGLSWIDFFQGTDVEVETEVDLSLKQQLLDVIIIRKGPGPVSRALPDGFEDLATYNLITFKSHQEALDTWALWELIGHFVNYRKQSGPSLQELLPEHDYRLFAVCARFPQNLAQEATLTELRPGIFEVRGFGLAVRVIVVARLPQHENNAMLHLFSAREELLRYGQQHYHPHSSETSSFLLKLFSAYGEDMTSSEKLQKFARESIEELLNSLPPEELRKRLAPEERIKGMTVEELAKVLPPEIIEAIRKLPPRNGSGSK